MLGKNFSRWHFEFLLIFLSFFPENGLSHFMQSPQETICMKSQSLFSGKKIRKKKKIINLSSAEFAAKVVKAWFNTEEQEELDITLFKHLNCQNLTGR